MFKRSLRNMLLTGLAFVVMLWCVFAVGFMWSVRTRNPDGDWWALWPVVKAMYDLLPIGLPLSLIATLIAVPVVRKPAFGKIDSSDHRRAPNYRLVEDSVKTRVRGELHKLQTTARAALGGLTGIPAGCTVRVNLLLPMPKAVPDSPPGHLKSVETVGAYRDGETENPFAPGEGVSGKTYFTHAVQAEAGATGVSKEKLDRMTDGLACVIGFPLELPDKARSTFGVVCIDVLGTCNPAEANQLRLLKNSGPLAAGVEKIAELLDPGKVPAFLVEINVVELHAKWKFWKWWS